jgi:Tol biopolymer transport system component
VTRAALFLTAVIAAFAAAGGGAEAAWEQAQIVSSSPERFEQGDDTTRAVALSLDGRYAAFETRARNFFADDDPDPPGHFREGGIFRRNLASGELELVAYGDLKTAAGGLVTFGAHNPSINGDGRFVVFSTAYQLRPDRDTNTKIDAYVRDMARPLGDPEAFELVSARDGGDVAATYAGAGLFGSEVTTGTSISADGQRIVFRTRAASDLPAAELATVPTGQLFVRDRATRSTVLVTRWMDNGSPAGGVGSTDSAGISADGSTVLWTGANTYAQIGGETRLQTRFLNGEVLDSGRRHYLWQRWVDGPAAPTRRVTGAADPDDPACPLDAFVIPDPTASGPCYGPLVNSEETTFSPINSKVPTMSADGTRVAFVTVPSMRPVDTGNHFDLFLADMRAGVSRKAGTVELTREGAITTDEETNSDIESATISADGRRIAFVSNRTRFILPSPRLIGEPAAEDVAELYVLDLDRMEITRVSRAFDGGEIDGSISNGVSLSADGRRIAFLSAATNLFFGDTNQTPDAYVVAESEQDGRAQAVHEPPFRDSTPSPKGYGQSTRQGISVSVTRASRGRMRVRVRVPGPGSIAVRALAQRRAPRARGRLIAQGRASSLGPRRVSILLRPAGVYRSQVRTRGRVRARLSVTFRPSGSGAPVQVRRTVTFAG